MKEILEYQKLDGQLRQIEKQINESNERKTYARIRGVWADFQEQLKKMELRSRELNIMLENAIKTMAEKNSLLSEYNSSADSAQDLQEVDFMLKKLADVERTLNQAERDIKSVISEAEEISNKYDNYRSKYPLVQAQARDAKAKFEELRESRKDEIVQLRAQLREVAKDIPQGVIEEYERLKRQGIYPPYVALRGTNQCSGCSMELATGQVYALNEKGSIRCEHCRRIIYKE